MNSAQPRYDLLRLAALACLLSLASPLVGQNRPRFPISAETVAGALAVHGFAVSPAQISLPARLTSAQAAPALTLFRAQRSGDGRVQAQMRCATTADCLPFLVSLEVPADIAEQILQPSHSSSGAPASSDLASPTSSASAAPTAKPVLHRGQPLVLWIEEGHITIHLPAIALDGGAPGQQVRVVTADRKSSFRAVLLDRGNARGIVE